jgi:sortase A
MDQQEHASAQKPPFAAFLATTMVIFGLTLSAADSVGFVPDYIDGTTPTQTRTVALSSLPELGTDDSAVATTTVHMNETALPNRITISAIGLDLPIQNSSSRDVETLDEALMKGPVRYVDSAKLGEQGNVLVFAHSSHLPIVHNQMFKAFNRISELKTGDLITVYGGGKEYIYNVTSVRQADATETLIDLSPKNGSKLTLSTCDTLTSKTSRFVVEADFVGVSE